jgi:hypothetical protein
MVVQSHDTLCRLISLGSESFTAQLDAWLEDVASVNSQEAYAWARRLKRTIHRMRPLTAGSC